MGKDCLAFISIIRIRVKRMAIYYYYILFYPSRNKTLKLRMEFVKGYIVSEKEHEIIARAHFRNSLASQYVRYCRGKCKEIKLFHTDLQESSRAEPSRSPRQEMAIHYVSRV